MQLQLRGLDHVYQTPTRQGGKGMGGKAGGELRLKDDEEPEEEDAVQREAIYKYQYKCKIKEKF